MNSNHVRRFRPLIGGIEVFNPGAGDSGTLGFIAQAAAGEKWLVSCYHVLCRAAGAPAPDDEPVYQGGVSAGAEVARTVAAKRDTALDVAAARLSVEGSAYVLGFGPLYRAGDPLVGMRVVKSGASTGVTEGIVQQVREDAVTIEVPPEFPADFDLVERGDSGSPWIDTETGRLVALHTSGTVSGINKAFAVPVKAVLAALGLELLTAD